MTGGQSRNYISKNSVADMRMLIWMSGNKLKDRNKKKEKEKIRGKLEVALIKHKMRENRLR